jgi:CBS domain containing-hemolysin-like protein
MAIVVDEFGSAVGVITMEDIIEEVVGDIDVGYEFEEFSPRKRRQYRVLDEVAEQYEMDARLPVSELNDVLGLSLPTSEFHTVGGLIMARLRRLPRVGDEILEGGFRFRVKAASGPSITLIAVERDRPQTTERRRWPRLGKE